LHKCPLRVRCGGRYASFGLCGKPEVRALFPRGGQKSSLPPPRHIAVGSRLLPLLQAASRGSENRRAHRGARRARPTTQGQTATDRCASANARITASPHGRYAAENSGRCRGAGEGGSGGTAGIGFAGMVGRGTGTSGRSRTVRSRSAMRAVDGAAGVSMPRTLVRRWQGRPVWRGKSGRRSVQRQRPDAWTGPSSGRRAGRCSVSPFGAATSRLTLSPASGY